MIPSAQRLLVALLGLVLLFGQHLPLLAGSSEGAGERVLLCTGSGLRWVLLDESPEPEAVKSSCPWCRLDEDDAGLVETRGLQLEDIGRSGAFYNAYTIASSAIEWSAAVGSAWDSDLNDAHEPTPWQALPCAHRLLPEALPFSVFSERALRTSSRLASSACGRACQPRAPPAPL